MVEAADDVQKRGLSRPVGANDGDDLSSMNVEADVKAWTAPKWTLIPSTRRSGSRPALPAGPGAAISSSCAVTGI
jgi:hypothetical protein